MTFSSLVFLFIFFPIVFILYAIGKNNLYRNILLVVTSLIFYAYGEPVAVFIMLISICLNYVFGLMCGEVFANRKKHSSAVTIKAFKNIGLILAVVLNIGLLIVFKYGDFFLNSLGLGRYALHLQLPIGISFFTFQGLSYVIDVYRDKKCVQKNLLSIMLYISFFPQLIAGPIVKYHDVKKQLKKRKLTNARVAKGLQRFIFGLGKKVIIAGPMGLMVDSIYSLNPTSVGMWTAWIAGFSYMFQIYFDFSGYSDMAIGLGCIFGFDFKENFNNPYAAGSLQDFWRRWHISLSTWFKEYVYIPLGGNRHGLFRTMINKFIVFFLTGLWHGANWTFICWGLLHGIGVSIEGMIKKKCTNAHVKVSKGISTVIKLFSHAYVLLFVMAAFIIFRADSLGVAVTMIGKLFGGLGSNAIAFSCITPTYLIALILALVCSSAWLNGLVEKTRTWVLQLFSLLVFVISVAMIIAGGYNPFIYFRF